MSKKFKIKLSKFLSYLMLFSFFAISTLSSVKPAMAAVSGAFNEDFEAGSSAWTTTQGTWSVVTDGSKAFYKSGTDEGRAYRGDMSWKDYAVEAKIKVDNFNGGNRAMLCGRYKDGNNYYAISLYNSNGGKLEIRKKFSGSSSTLQTVDFPLSIGVWYDVKLEMQGSTIKAYVNGELKLTATDSSLTAGAVGLVPMKVAAKYDNIIVDGTGSTTPTPITYPTPTLTPNTTASGASSVTVTIGNFGTASIKQYKINSGAWQNYTAPVVVTSNCTIYAQGSDSAGNTSAIGNLVISNIGGTTPVSYPTPTLTPNTTTSGASSVTVTIGNFGTAPIKQYRINSGSWQNYTAPVVVTSNCTVYAQGSDSAGNASAIGSLVIGNIGTTTPPTGNGIIESKGWLESAYVKWTAVQGASSYNVYYKLASAADSQYKIIDTKLIRKYSTYFRADVLGLPAGNYVIKVVPVINNAEDNAKASLSPSLQVKAHAREGFAFSAQSPMGTASGGYNNDGTVPSNAQILYVTASTANTITLDVITSSSGTKTTCTGLAAILTARGKGYDKTPLIIRMIGQVKDTNITGLNSNGFLQIKGCYNVTFEGVGEDATVYGWGFLIRDARNIEIRNVGIMLFKDDGVSLDTNNANIWIHNNDIFYGKAGSDADQVKGDGSTDVKGNSTYVTISYNHYWDSGKMSLCGMSDTQEFFVTYHHNWFDHSDSRHPRIRVGTIHIYNNYFDGVSKYGVGVTKGSSAFVEANYFRNAKYPMLTSLQGTDVYGTNEGTFSGEAGGMIKAFNNTVLGATRLVYHNEDPVQFDAYLASSRTEAVPSSYKTVSGGTTYNNFDTKSTMYSYSPTAPADVPSNVTTYGGRLNGGDFKWTFTAADDTDSNVNSALMSKITSYTTTLVSVQ